MSVGTSSWVAAAMVMGVCACGSSSGGGGSLDAGGGDAGTSAGAGGGGGTTTGGSGGAGGGSTGGVGGATGGVGGAAGSSSGGVGAAGGSGGSGGVPAGTVKGVITRTGTLAMPVDGKGTIYVDVGPECPYTTSFAGAQTATIPNADMNDPNVEIEWQLTGVAPGTYQVWGWLDDNGDTIPSSPFPSGDPGNFPACVTVTVTATAGATANLVFNAII